MPHHQENLPGSPARKSPRKDRRGKRRPESEQGPKDPTEVRPTVGRSRPVPPSQKSPAEQIALFPEPEDLLLALFHGTKYLAELRASRRAWGWLSFRAISELVLRASADPTSQVRQFHVHQHNEEVLGLSLEIQVQGKESWTLHLKKVDAASDVPWD